MEKDKFNPNKAATREEVVWMLIGALKITPSEGFDINKKADLSQFKDKPSSFSEGRMAIAVGNGIIGGYPDKTLKPKSSITRAEFAVIIGRLIKEDAPAGFSPFWDYIPAWSLTEIKKVYSKEIVKGYPDGTFGANKNVTKAEALTMIKRWKDKQKPMSSTSYVSENAPKEFKEVYNVYPNNTACGSTRLSYSNKGVPQWGPTFHTDIYIAADEESHDIVIKNRDTATLEAAKNILKVYFPTEYENVYQRAIKVEKPEQKFLGQVFDGKKTDCFIDGDLVIRVYIK